MTFNLSNFDNASENSDLFSLLGIEKTNDYDVVKQAYEATKQKLRQSQQSPWKIQASTALLVLDKVWGKVDSQKAFNSYVETGNYLTDKGLQFENPEDEDKVIYINVPFLSREHFGVSDNNDEIFSMNALNTVNNFQQNFDSNDFLRILNNHCSKYKQQVGLTFAEAEKIQMQHSYRYFYLVVKVSVPAKALSSNKLSEEDMHPNYAGMGGEPYHWLPKGVTLNDTNIISIAPMVHYTNTNRIHRPVLRPEDVWPAKGMDYTENAGNPFLPIHNPKPNFVPLNNPNAKYPEPILQLPPEKIITIKHLRDNKQIKVLLDAIDALEHHANNMEEGKDKKETILSTTNDLKKQLNMFLNYVSTTEHTIETFTQDLEVFKKQIHATIHRTRDFDEKSNDEIFGTHDNNKYLKDILLACTVIGALPLLAKLLYSRCTEGHWVGFFSQTASTQKAHTIDLCADALSSSTIRPD